MLQEPDNFNNKDIIVPFKNNKETYKCFTIKVGTKIFRGDHERKVLPSTEVPVFFSDMISATIYTRGDLSKLSGFRVKKQPKLFQLSYENLVKMFDEDDRLTKEEKTALDIYLQVKDDLPPFIVPVFFLKPENAQGEHKLYLNRRILNCVCRLGYDGWIAMPDTLLQRNLDQAYYKETGKTRFRLNVYNPEIALCKWTDFIDVME